MTNNIIVLGICMLSIIAIIVSGMIVSISKKNAPVVNSTPRLGLSYEEVNVIIEGIISEIFNNKYLLYYKLKEITIIPKMDEEVTNITKEVISAFSDTFIHECENYYTKEFLVMMITRKVQILLVDYTNTNKPNTK